MDNFLSDYLRHVLYSVLHYNRQIAYSEFYFTEVPWPDFDKAELEKAIEAYQKRNRRFGGLTEE